MYLVIFRVKVFCFCFIHKFYLCDWTKSRIFFYLSNTNSVIRWGGGRARYFLSWAVSIVGNGLLIWIWPWSIYEGPASSFTTDWAPPSCHDDRRFSHWTASAPVWVANLIQAFRLYASPFSGKNRSITIWAYTLNSHVNEWQCIPIFL